MQNKLYEAILCFVSVVPGVFCKSPSPSFRRMLLCSRNDLLIKKLDSPSASWRGV